MLIELIKNKEPTSLEIGYQYLTKPNCVGLSSNKIIRIDDIKGIDVTYSYPGQTGDLKGRFHRPKEEVERSVILYPMNRSL